MQAGSRVDVPMGEFWIGGGCRNDLRRVKLATSVAHVSGKPIVGAESFTGLPAQAKWQEYPFSMKAQGDWMYTLGLNRYIFHRYTQQPHPDAVPGMTMGPWGFHFDRTNTWFDKGKSWLDYVTRCQHILRQGLFVADLAYYTGQDAPLATLSPNEMQPPLPAGYDFDHMDAEAILNRMKVEDGRIVMPDGMSYRLLVLPDRADMTLDVLRKIRDLVRDGMCVSGPKPRHSPGLSGYPGSELETRRLADEIWGGMDGKTVTERTVGKGWVYWGQPLETVLAKLNTKPDFEFTARSADAPINYIHRRAGEAEMYFIANRRRKSEDLVCTFRVDGKKPELWDAATGEITPLEFYQFVDGRVRVPVRLDPVGSVFVVFRSPAPERRLQTLFKDGAAVLGTTPFPPPARGLHPKETTTFTISLWVKPELDIVLPDETIEGRSPGASYAIYPPQGDVLYGKGHAACGLSAGRNGVIVYERARGYFPSVLVAEMPLSGWTHLALAYKGGVPSLYVDGVLVRQGKKSGRTVHPGLGEAFQDDGAFYFEGHMDEPQLFPEALADEQIRKLAAAGIPDPEEPPPAELASGSNGNLLVWQNGLYTLRGDTGGSSVFEVKEIGRPPGSSRLLAGHVPAEVGRPREGEAAPVGVLA